MVKHAHTRTVLDRHVGNVLSWPFGQCWPEAFRRTLDVVGDYIGPKRNTPDPEECTVELVRKHIERYGPVAREDIAYWSFLRKDEVDLALKALKKDLIRERLTSSQEYFSFGEGPGEVVEPPGVIILPEFDSLMMGYKDKSRFLSHDQIKNVFGNFAAVNRTILLDGFVAATWKRKRNREGISVDVNSLRTLRGKEKGQLRQSSQTTPTIKRPRFRSDSKDRKVYLLTA